jgi:hypothetical protein
VKSGKNKPVLTLGEATGGKPNHYGEISSFILPNSEMTVSYCTKYFETTNGDPDALYPDIALPHLHFISVVTSKPAGRSC